MADGYCESEISAACGTLWLERTLAFSYSLLIVIAVMEPERRRFLKDKNCQPTFATAHDDDTNVADKSKRHVLHARLRAD